MDYSHPDENGLQSSDRQPPNLRSSHQRSRRSRNEESWVDVSSRASLLSLPSNTSHGIITDGLLVPLDGQRLPRQQTIREQSTPAARAGSTAGSSQDEYEDSESESDRVLSSSSEDVEQPSEEQDSHEEEDDDDEQKTALGVQTGHQTVFTPQPNVFSHPPNPSMDSASVPNSYFPRVTRITHSDRLPTNRMITNDTLAQAPSHRAQTLSQRTQPDHDAALRASLTTLLSCAAAVRPKQRNTAPELQRPNQPTTLRLVPASDLNGVHHRVPKIAPKRTSRESSKERHAKKLRPAKASPAGEEMVSPTVLTWMISAGVVLVFSAISFGAGYAWGKEVGQVEAQMACGNCSREAARASSGLRKLRWSAAAHSARA